MNCDICGSNFSRAHEKGNQMLECTSCKLRCHRFCYGYNNNQLTCDPCRDVSKKAVCHICGLKGLLKRLSDQQGMYVHVSCAIFSSTIQVISYQSMTFAMKSQIDKKSKDKCNICGRNGASISCADCKQFAHPHCVYQEQMERERQNEENKQWLIVMQFVPNNNCKGYNVSETHVKNELRSLQESMLLTYDKIKKKNAPQKDQTRQATDAFIQQYVHDCQESLTWNSQDKIKAYCQTHMNDKRIFCLCRTSNNTKQMMQCESCYEWYHFKCIKTKSHKEAYICDPCKEWTKKRIAFNLDDPKFLNFESIIIPTDIHIYHLFDLIPILIYFEMIQVKLLKHPMKPEDFINLKFFKLFLASLPIQPSSLIELDQILIKEKLIEEFKQKIQQFLPNFKSKELNQQYCEELAHQFRNKGYLIELEDGLIKTECISRKELKEVIRKGCQDQYLVEDVINQINQSVSNNKDIDLKKFMRSQHDKLYKALEKYQVAQQIRCKFQNMLRQSHMQIEYPPQLDNTTKVLQQGKLCVDYQTGKITKEQLQELVQSSSKNNITFNTITVIEDLLEELANLEINGTFDDIFSFQITSESLNNKVICYWRDQFVQLLRENCLSQLNQGKQIVLQNEILDHIIAIVKEEPLKQAYDRYLEINQQITRQLKNATPQKQIELIHSSPFISQQFFAIKNQFEFQVNTQKKLEGPISLKELEEIKDICAENKLPLVTQAREDQIHSSLKLMKSLHFNLTPEEIEPLYAYKCKELNLFIYNVIAQQDFLTQFHQLLYDCTDTIPNMIERCSVYRDQELSFQVLKQLKLGDNIHPEIEAVANHFKKALWKSEAQECLLNLIDPQKAQQLLNQENQDERLRRKLQNVVDQYAEWVTQFNQIEIDMGDPKPNNKLIQLINSHIFIPDAYHKQLWQKYMQIQWAQKAHSFIQERASACSLRTLKRVAEVLQIPQCAILQKLTVLMEQTEELQNKVKEYYDQRSTWGRNRERELAQLKGYKSYHRYIESKADARYISKLYAQCQEAPSLKVKEMYEDIQEIKVIIAQFNELVTNEPDNNTYLERLLKIRQYYTMQFLKVKGFNLMLMYNLIKQQSLYNVKSLTPSHELTERLDEISVLIALGGDEWYQKFSQSYRPTKQSEEFKIIDNSLNDDFEWVKWLEQDSVQDFSAKKVKKQIKIQKKTEIKVTVDEEERNASRNLIQSYLKKYNQKFSDSQVRMLETQIFMENNQNKAQYDKEFLKVKFVLKQKKIQDLNYQTIKKLYKNLVQQKRSSGLGLKLESVSLIPKLEVQRSSSKIQTEVITQVPMDEIEIRLPLNEPEPEPPQKLFQEFNEEILYPEQIQKQKKQLYSIGDVQILITKKSSTDKHSYVIQPSLLTYDSLNSNKFPPLDIQINCDSYSPAANAVEFFQSKKNLIIGWVYSKTLAHAGDLFKLADKLKQNKQCVGCKKDNFGITLIYYEYLSKLKPTTKWILYQEELRYYNYIFSNQPLMSSLQKYSNLEKFKPHLCFVLYGKENKICESPMAPLKIDYVNIYKIQNFAKIIEAQKQSKKKNNEPKEIHEMIMDIPNIQSLLG